jgi:hypothetical protein
MMRHWLLMLFVAFLGTAARRFPAALAHTVEAQVTSAGTSFARAMSSAATPNTMRAIEAKDGKCNLTTVRTCSSS